MNREEILNLNKQDNQRFDERQKGGIVDACNKAYRVSRFLCALIIALDYVLMRQVNVAVLSILMVMNGVYLYYMYKTSSKKIDIVLGITYSVIGVLLFVKYIIEIFR